MCEEFDKARSTVVSMNLCISHLLEVNSKEIRGVTGLAPKVAYTVYTVTLFPRGSTL